MAIYTYRCPVCDRRKEVVQSIKSYCEAPDVPVCEDQEHRVFMERYLTAPLVSFDTAPWAAYVSPIDGEVIDSRAKRNEHMAKHGVVMFDEIQPDIARRRQEIRKEAEASLRQDIIAATHRVVDHGHKPAVESVENLVPAE